MLQKTSPEIGGMGHSVKRKEDLRFIQGKGTYVDDLHLPGMVYGHMVRTPYAHAKIGAIRTEEAMKLPGVLAVIAGHDLEKAGLAWMPRGKRGRPGMGTGKVFREGRSEQSQDDSGNCLCGLHKYPGRC